MIKESDAGYRMCDNNRFQFSNQVPVIIYGAGGDGRRAVKYLLELGYHVIAVIDRRADEIQEVNGVPVRQIEELRNVYVNTPNIVLIITVKNVFEHVGIARICLECGIHRIIYKPYPILQGAHGVWDSINTAYEKIITQQINFDHLEIAETSENILFRQRDCLLVRKDTDTVIVNAPAEMLCNYDREVLWARIPMNHFFPIIDLYENLLNQSNNWEECCSFFLLYCGSWLFDNQLQMTERLRQSLINSRVRIFYEMQKKCDFDRNFFEINAPSVEIGTENRFFLNSSGRNRVCFQAAKGYNYIPVRMKKQDYNRWMNEADLEKILSIIKKKGRIFCTISHPMLVEIPSVAEDYIRLACRSIADHMVKQIYSSSIEHRETYDILDQAWVQRRLADDLVGVYVKDEGAISRYLRRCGFHIKRLLFGIDADELAFCHKIDRLLRYSQFEEINDVKNCNWSEFKYLVLDSRMIYKIPDDVRAEYVYLIDWNHQFQDISNLTLIFTAMWDGQFVHGYILKRK